jgi:hypothetical protein
VSIRRADDKRTFLMAFSRRMTAVRVKKTRQIIMKRAAKALAAAPSPSYKHRERIFARY